NGVFFITAERQGVICKTSDYHDTGKINFATQSGPMLVVDGKIHSAFKNGSDNLNIRNGVGILPNKKLLFVMSKKEVNLYSFATYFKNSGCKNALYLDGFVSRTYLPEKKWIQTDGNFGVIIAVTK
ncbi:MAG TPA: phosphodiester glycosidase family protein, partial [Nitrosopumilaceae archaeon]|nr:phosphodiester glycosidase family protein [Nitrosopumilaceae archaeon]